MRQIGHLKGSFGPTRYRRVLSIQGASAMSYTFHCGLLFLVVRKHGRERLHVSAGMKLKICFDLRHKFGYSLVSVLIQINDVVTPLAERPAWESSRVIMVKVKSASFRQTSANGAPSILRGNEGDKLLPGHINDTEPAPHGLGVDLLTALARSVPALCGKAPRSVLDMVFLRLR